MGREKERKRAGEPKAESGQLTMCEHTTQHGSSTGKNNSGLQQNNHATYHGDRDVFGMTLASLFLEYRIELGAPHYIEAANFNRDCNEELPTKKKDSKGISQCQDCKHLQTA